MVIEQEIRELEKPNQADLGQKRLIMELLGTGRGGRRQLVIRTTSVGACGPL